MNIALCNHNKRYSDRDHWDRDACGDPCPDKRHSAAEHENEGNGQKRQIPRRRLLEFHDFTSLYSVHDALTGVSTHRRKPLSSRPVAGI